ncbi:MAG: fucose isomerase, partial [Verrucomicrobiia bacterium]
MPSPLLPTIQLIANGDLRLAANQKCWPAQSQMEAALIRQIEALGARVERAHPFKPELQHGFISSQKEGMEVFSTIDPERPLIVAEAVWQYSHHILHGLITHRAPILTVANWSGTWPGLVGMLNLNGSLTKAGVRYSTLWSQDFQDAFFLESLGHWLKTGSHVHQTPHVWPLAGLVVPERAKKVAGEIADNLRRCKSIMAVFDEGCMGMYNAI